jgi:hypothetical protein
MVIQRENWGPAAAHPGGRETRGDQYPHLTDSQPEAPAATDEEHAEPAAEVLAQDAEDADDSALHRKLLADGVFTPEELARHYGLSTEEVDALSKSKPPSRQSVEQELAAIQQRMRTDRAGYFKDKAQSRYLEHIEQLQALKAAPAKSKPDKGGDASRASIDAELAAIRKTMREDRRAYDRDPKMQARHLELITAREDAIEVARQTEQTQTTVQAVLDAVEDPEAFEGDFDSMFGSLPEQAQTAIRYEFAQPPASPARPASEADLKRFASVPEHAELVREWGREAGRKLAIVRTRLDRLLSAGEMEAASVWFDELPGAQAKAVLDALAG